MKLTDLLVERLITMGAEKPSARLVDELEKTLAPRIKAMVEKAVTPKVAAKAFAATLATQAPAS